MYTIKTTEKTTNQDTIIELKNANNSTFVKIYLNLGASAQELTLNGHTIIEDLTPLTYNNTYASSILFPFANRIKDGKYTFEGKEYHFEINEPGNNNALHGLVYNKTFQIKEQKTTETSASVTLTYVEENESAGFPYTYTLELEYILTDSSLDINVLVTNTDSKTFPFTLGWHPYFSTSNLFESTLNFDCDTQFTLDERCITTGTKTIKNIPVFEVKDKNLDDCFILNSNKTQFNTPDFALQISASSNENFLQLYTPPKVNVIAIEPTTGVSDSFNNKVGLQLLKPNHNYKVNWQVKLI
ncbi:aldose 1-epimerase [Mariniflexile sp.]|uniref:aldose 1-epimerase n=1 Tax=Mariniflexile sp. TaxID=1979402 RepID=UPI0035667D67